MIYASSSKEIVKILQEFCYKKCEGINYDNNYRSAILELTLFCDIPATRWNPIIASKTCSECICTDYYNVTEFILKSSTCREFMGWYVCYFNINLSSIKNSAD